MHINRTCLSLAVLVLTFAAVANADPQRGFFYPGFRSTESPFSKAGQQYWVSPTGDDEGAGSQAKPWKTITHARKSIRPGDVVSILPGLYHFHCQFGPAGPNEDAKTVFRAADPTFKTGRVVITANAELAAPTWSLSDNLSLQRLWIGGAYANAHKSGGGSYSSRNSEIVGCTFFNSQGFAGGPAYNWLFQNNRMVHQGKGTHGHSMYMAGGARHDLPWNSRNLHVLGNTIVGGEGYAFHCWHSPVSATIAGNFSSGNYWSLVLQGPNHSCHHNVFWKPRGNVGAGATGRVGFNAWLPARLRRFDHLVFGSPHPVWQAGKTPPIRSKRSAEKIYLLYDAHIRGVPETEHFLLTGKKWTGKLQLPRLRGDATTLNSPDKTTVRPAFFPRSASEIDTAVAAISKYFRDHDPQQISDDKTGQLEALFDILKVKYRTEPGDYANFPPMAQDKDDGTYGVH
ncbi:MAG: right-handed parallel beta-helix repeat-containing protein [Planctomycetaceae bacterium]